MSIHHQQLDALDARHHRRVKSMTFIGAAVLMFVALWASDFRIGKFDLSALWQRDPSPEPVATAPVAAPVAINPNQPTLDASKPLPGLEASLSKDPLSLILVRTEPGRNASEGRAFLGTARENPQTYAGGALLLNGARIKEIYSDHVVLERNGKQAKLFVDGSKQNKKALNDLLTVGGQPEVKQAAITHHEQITDYLRPSPVYDGQVLKGYEVYAGAKSGVFSQLGLQNGDVILSLNDQPFTDPQQAMQLFDQLLQGIAMTASVERKGKVERIAVDGGVIIKEHEWAKQIAANPSPPSGPMP
jgi:hypothetical protein